MDPEHLRAQHGEDALLAERFGFKRSGHYVEVGALDGELLSNTFYFEKALGWSGVLVEPNPKQAALCRTNRPGSIVAELAAMAPGHPERVTLQVASKDEGFSTLAPNRTYRRLLSERGVALAPIEVEAVTLDHVLQAAELPTIDFLTIDVEGHELDVLRGFDAQAWAPEVILLESATGAPDPRISLLLFRAGYARVRRVVVNDWYEQLPLGTRSYHLAATYVSSVPAVARTVVRETLRRLRLLERVRRIRRRRQARTNNPSA